MPIGVRTPGPIHLFVKFRGGSDQYLGTCVAAPEPEAEKFKLPVMNDIGGRSVPFQLVQDGEQWMVLATMNRFNLTMIQQIRALESGTMPPPSGAALATTLGSELQKARGTLVIGRTDFQLTALNEYASSPSAGVFTGGTSDLPTSRRFFSCNMRKYKESTAGTRVLEVAMAIECLPEFQGYSGTTAFKTYTEIDSPSSSLIT